ncbi:hypothetical protein AWRI1631_151690 [Saccharomyces cerevisiae AWRI1631]|uniref:Uncharacterized protein n=1 Tax=Saccharomyces cerevisiae (strain AWRI1631) TaxID=545124 RepID=B5VRR1_YEAS6|nr:hypothetical protein AWRI1631_151690 [Saccharomyces cerevisiae AWRI1631]
MQIPFSPLGYLSFFSLLIKKIYGQRGASFLFTLITL